MKKNEDIRIQKSKKAIQSAFVDLMKEEGFSKITVKQIIACANVNRSTFYAHYIDKYDLLQQVEENLLDSILSYMNQAPTDQIIHHTIDHQSMLAYINRMLQYMFENGEIFMLLYGPNGDPDFHNKLNHMVHTIYIEKELAKKFSIPEDYAMSAIIGMIISLIGTWIEKGFTETPEEFANIIIEVTSALQSNLVK